VIYVCGIAHFVLCRKFYKENFSYKKMKKKYSFLFGILLVLIAIILIFLVFLGHKSSAVGCVYLYKVNNFSDNVFGIANDITGEYRLMSWPLNVGDIELNDGYFVGGGFSCPPKIEEWVVLNLTKETLLNSFGYSGCTELHKETYPDCYSGKYKKGQNAECDEISERERHSETTICPVIFSEQRNILGSVVFEKFYVCSSLDERNDDLIISDKFLQENCDSLI